MLVDGTPACILYLSAKLFIPDKLEATELTLAIEPPTLFTFVIATATVFIFVALVFTALIFVSFPATAFILEAFVFTALSPFHSSSYDKHLQLCLMTQTHRKSRLLLRQSG